MTNPQEEATMPRRAYSYLRVSCLAQVSGDGLRRQGDFAEQICQEEGWCLDDSLRFVDRGRSAFHGDNARIGALSMFLAAVKSGRVAPGSVVIIENIDRLSRQEVDEAYDLFRAILKSGVWIATREPRRVYRRETAGNMIDLLEPLFIMARGHEESKIKSVRLTAHWDERRRQAREAGRPIGKRCPAWVELVPGGGYRLRPGPAATVRAVFRLCREGMGLGQIVDWLRARPAEHPPFGSSRVWSRSYLRLIIKRRAALGEWQPRQGRDGRNMKPAGSPVVAFWPAAVSEDDWQLAQAAVAGRKGKRGRPGNSEANLFTGLVREAQTGERMAVRSFRFGPDIRRHYLVATRLGDSCAKGLGMPYRDFEECVLEELRMMLAADILPPSPERDAREGRIRELTARLVALDQREATLQAAAADPEQTGADSILTVLRQVAAHKQTAAKELDALKWESRTGRAEALGDTQSIIDLLHDATPEEATEYRRRLKGALVWVVEEIRLLVQPVSRTARIGHILIYLRGGRRRYVRSFSQLRHAVEPWHCDGLDFRAGEIPDAATHALAEP